METEKLSVVVFEKISYPYHVGKGIVKSKYFKNVVVVGINPEAAWEYEWLNVYTGFASLILAWEFAIKLAKDNSFKLNPETGLVCLDN